MKIALTKSDKILIGITVLLYIVGFILGGWNIFINLIFLFFVVTLIKKGHNKGKLSTLHLIALMVFIGLNILIKIGFFLNSYQNYSLKKTTENNKVITKNSDTTNNVEIIWKTYSSAVMKISFEYPSKLLMGVNDGKVGETKDNQDILYHKIYIGNKASQVAIPTADSIDAPFEIDFYPNNILIDYSLGKPLNEAINEFKKNTISSYTPETLKTSSVSVGNKSATQYEGQYSSYLAMGNQFHKTVLIEINNGIFLINNNFVIGGDAFSNTVFERMISSFQFLK
jgi:hypothetical protein